MPAARTAAATDGTSGKQGRQTVGIPQDAVKKLDALIERTAAALKRTAGISVVLSRAQMVESLISDAHDKPAPDTSAE